MLLSLMCFQFLVNQSQMRHKFMSIFNIILDFFYILQGPIMLNLSCTCGINYNRAVNDVHRQMHGFNFYFWFLDMVKKKWMII